MDWLIRRLDRDFLPQEPAEANRFFVPMSTIGSILKILMQVGLTTVILIRSLKLYQV
jgi:hypothetical protein